MERWFHDGLIVYATLFAIIIISLLVIEIVH